MTNNYAESILPQLEGLPMNKQTFYYIFIILEHFEFENKL